MITGLRAGLHCGSTTQQVILTLRRVITGLRAGLHCGMKVRQSVNEALDAVITGLRAGLHCGGLVRVPHVAGDLV